MIVARYGISCFWRLWGIGKPSLNQLSLIACYAAQVFCEVSWMLWCGVFLIKEIFLLCDLLTSLSQRSFLGEILPFSALKLIFFNLLIFSRSHCWSIYRKVLFWILLLLIWPLYICRGGAPYPVKTFFQLFGKVLFTFWLNSVKVVRSKLSSNHHFWKLLWVSQNAWFFSLQLMGCGKAPVFFDD